MWTSPRDCGLGWGVHACRAVGGREVPSLLPGALLWDIIVSPHSFLDNMELGEGPFDGIPLHAPPLGLGFHPLPQWVGDLPSHSDLAVLMEFGLRAIGGLSHLHITPWLLPLRMVTREGQAPRTQLSIGGLRVEELSAVRVCLPRC